MKKTSVVTAAAVLSAGVHGSNVMNVHARATASIELPNDGMTPKPTPPPGVALDGFSGGLFRRADTTTQSPLTMMIAPDNTCGWISGTQAVPYTCGAGGTCGLVQAQSSFSGAIICFNAVTYNFRLSCVDYKQFYTSSACDHLCAENTQITKCTNALMPYCNTVAFPGSITDYWCYSASYSTPQLAQTTWIGETDQRSYSPFVHTLTTSAGGGSLAGPSVTGSVTSPSTTQSGSGSNNNGNDTGNNNSNGNNGNNSNGGHSKSNVGAIVGGVVGGIAAIGLCLVGLFLLRRKKNKEAPATQSPPSGMAQQPYYNPNTGGSPPQGYPPQGFVPQGYPPQQQYAQTTPPPQGYYPQQAAAVDPSSPTASHVTDPRVSQMTTSPGPTWTNSPNQSPPPPGQQQSQSQPAAGFQPVLAPVASSAKQPHHSQGVIHEVTAQTSENHRGEMHELA